MAETAETEVLDFPPPDCGAEIADEPDPAFGETDDDEFESPEAEEPEPDDDDDDDDESDDSDDV